MLLKDISIKHQKTDVIQSIDLSIDSGEVFVLMGPSGSGKSTLLKGIAGLLPLSSGLITWEKDKGTVGLVFQEPRLFPHLTVLENITFGLRTKRIPVKERRAKGKQFLKILRLENLENHYPHQLSGGQQQRVSLGRSLMLKPNLLLLDEPFSSLDTTLRLELIDWLLQLQKELGFSVIWVTHYLDEAFSVADRIGILMGGKLLQVAVPEVLFQSPASERVASFLSLPNRFPREQWQKWFQIDGMTSEINDMGWIPATKLQIVDEAATNLEKDKVAYISGEVVRKVPGKDGYSLFLQSGEVILEVIIAGWENVPNLHSKVKVRVSFDQIHWYSK
ncbi:ABC transporter ATP-binding protein [Neobacillus sp. LXY-1]|uniref:ABC transporter ATP-binding protein n=1 Tax=Neobacillus sp. LXY-1 TaxID=3379133 RepID=UPI003EE09070